MRKKILTLMTILLVSGVLSFALSAQADLIGSKDIVESGGGSNQLDSLLFEFCFGCAPVPGEPWAFLFNDTYFDTIGQTIYATSDSDPAFDTAADILTNGVPDAVYYQVGYGGYGGPDYYFFDHISGASDIDFQGYDIKTISITVNDLTFTANSSGGTDYYFQGSLKIYGTVVPEPISSILFVTGGTLFAGRRYLKKKKTA